MPDAEAPGLDFPKRASGIDLIGPADANGYREQQWLICVDGSRYVQATQRLYHVLLHADGKTSIEEIARRVSASLGGEMTSDQVRWLLRERLLPAGLLASASSTAGVEGEEKAGPRPGESGTASLRAPPRTPHLGIQHRLPILSYRATAPITAWLQHLYSPPLVVWIVAFAAAINIWLYTGSGFRDAVHALLVRPGLLLVLLVLDIPLRVFHELGHASAMRRAGAPYGEIGVALYFVVPVYYTDVTHAYRLPRRDRVRVDLGGMYFDLVSTIALAAAFAVTRQEVLLLAIVAIGLNMIREFTPFMRFDGYYLMADLLGVHEPLSLVWPLAAEHWPWSRTGKPRASGLTSFAKLALAAYVAIVAVFLLRPLLLLAGLGWPAVQQFVLTGRILAMDVGQGWRTHDPSLVLTSSLELVFWSIIPVGLGLTSVGLVRLGARLAASLRHRARELRASAPATQGAAISQVQDSPAPGMEPVVAVANGGAEASLDPLVVDAAAEAKAEPAPVDEGSNGLTQPEPAGRPAADDVFERTLQRASADYVAALKALIGEVGVLNQEQLASKDRRIEELLSRVSAAERERDTLQASVDRLNAAFERSIGDLVSLDQELVRRADMIRREWYTAVMLTTQAQPTRHDR